MGAPSQAQTGLSNIFSGFSQGLEKGAQLSDSANQRMMLQEAMRARQGDKLTEDREKHIIPGAYKSKLWSAMTGQPIPKELDDNRDTPQFVWDDLLKKYSADHRGTGKGGGKSGLTPKDEDAISRITQGLTNLKQVEQMYKSTDAGKHGVAGTVANLPVVGGFLKSNPFFQNANPNLTNYNRAVEEARNAYSRATFGRVSNDILNHSLSLFPPAGVNKDQARMSLNELANTLKGVGDGIVNEKIAKGDDVGANAVKGRLDGLFGDMRFFPEEDVNTTQSAPGPGKIQTTFRDPAAAAPAPGGGGGRKPLADIFK